MAKQRHNPAPETTSKGPLAMLVLGAVLVAGLVAWALTRTVDTPSSSVMESATETIDTSGFTTTASTTPVPATTPTPTASNPGDIVTSTHAPQPQGDKAEVQRISAEDLRDKMKSGNVVVVDTRDVASYESSHIPGAINIPMASVESNLDRLPKEKEIVAYCT